MGDFDDFAKGLSEAHAEKQKSHDEEVRRRKEERNAQMAKAQAFLQSQVMPIFNDAKHAYEKLGLRSEIKTNWERELHMNPEVTFQVFGQKKRPFDDSTYEISGLEIAVKFNDGQLDVGLAPRSRHSAKPFSGSDLNAVRDGARLALQSYYERADPRSS